MSEKGVNVPMNKKNEQEENYIRAVIELTVKTFEEEGKGNLTAAYTITQLERVIKAIRESSLARKVSY